MAVHRINFKSNILEMPVDVNVITPTPKRHQNPEDYYTSEKKYPVLWLLHGGGGDHNDWLNYTNIIRYAEDKGFIVVCPNGLDSDFAPQPQFAGNYDFPEFFSHELMPFIYCYFPAGKEPENNFMSGPSMGGSGTLLLAMMHPEKFGAIAPLSCSLRNSPFLQDYQEYTGGEFRALAMKNRQMFPTEWADPSEGISIKELNAICKYPTIKEYLNSYDNTGSRYLETYSRLPKMYYTCGTKDPCYPKGLEFEKLTHKLGVENAFFEYVPGYAHEWSFWDLAIQKAMDFFAR